MKPDSKESNALHLWVVLARAAGAIARHASEDVARHELTLAEFGVLEALFHKGPMLQGELQRKILVSSGGMTYLVDRLIKRGLVKRVRCTEDARARWASLTKAGEDFVRRIFPAHRRAISEAVSGLNAVERRQAAALLRKLGLAAQAKLGNERTGKQDGK